MKRRSLYFDGEGGVSLKTEELDEPEDEEVMVKTLYSSVSRGSELLLYHDKVEENVSLDKSFDYSKSSPGRSFKYGYSCVGEIVSIGSEVSDEVLGDKVFCFNPHESHFLSPIDRLINLEEKIDPKNATFLPSLETAVNLTLDGRPTIGEDVVIFGQGVIGLLSTYVLNLFPLRNLVTIDKYNERIKISEELGSDVCLEAPIEVDDVKEILGSKKEGADLSFEITGDIEVLEKAVDVVGFGGRVIVGSWYGDKKGEINLDTDFHRNRVEIKSSQVSTIPQDYSNRWDKKRRIDTVLNLLKYSNFSDLITHEYDIQDAEEAYELLEDHPDKVIQLIFEY